VTLVQRRESMAHPVLQQRPLRSSETRRIEGIQGGNLWVDTEQLNLETAQFESIELHNWLWLYGFFLLRSELNNML